MPTLQQNSQLVLIGRVTWMMFGPAILLICAIMIVGSPGTGWKTGADIVYLFGLLATIGGRWIEHLGGNPRNAMGEPSTDRELRRYIIATAIAGTAIWVAANIVSNYLLK